MERIVVKIGGSAITYKESEFFPTKIEDIKKDFEKYARVPVIERLMKELYDADNFPLILVNGAGLFGHYLVLHQDSLERKEIIHDSVEFLNKQIVNYLKRLKVKTVSCTPFYKCTYAGGGNFCGMEDILNSGLDVLRNGGVLSTYGDIVPSLPGVKADCNLYKMISGDDLMVNLAGLWNADKIISVIDIEGVYTNDPKICKSARLLRKVRSNEKFVFDSMHGTDVTGGMEKKLKVLQYWASKGKKAQVISGWKEGYLKRALLGDESIGTLVVQ
jgi:isopentenyl phosphate kinase